MTPKKFLSAIQNLKFDNTFNPYSDICPIHDVKDAAQIRSNALLSMLKTAENIEIDSLWIGRDLGYRGGRRTGLALTDDIHLAAHAQRWNVKIKRATKGELVSERTAAVIWSMLFRIKSPIFLWNVFPLHPFEANNEFTNRSHNTNERKAGECILDDLISLLKPKRLIAIGNDAFKTAQRLNKKEEIIQIRHPSYGGQNIFLRQVQSIYELSKNSQRELPL